MDAYTNSQAVKDFVKRTGNDKALFKKGEDGKYLPMSEQSEEAQALFDGFKHDTSYNKETFSNSLAEAATIGGTVATLAVVGYGANKMLGNPVGKLYNKVSGKSKTKSSESLNKTENDSNDQSTSNDGDDFKNKHVGSLNDIDNITKESVKNQGDIEKIKEKLFTPGDADYAENYAKNHGWVDKNGKITAKGMENFKTNQESIQENKELSLDMQNGGIMSVKLSHSVSTDREGKMISKSHIRTADGTTKQSIGEITDLHAVDTTKTAAIRTGVGAVEDAGDMAGVEVDGVVVGYGANKMLGNPVGKGINSLRGNSKPVGKTKNKTQSNGTDNNGDTSVDKVNDHKKSSNELKSDIENYTKNAEKIQGDDDGNKVKETYYEDKKVTKQQLQEGVKSSLGRIRSASKSKLDSFVGGSKSSSQSTSNSFSGSENGSTYGSNHEQPNGPDDNFNDHKNSFNSNNIHNSTTPDMGSQGRMAKGTGLVGVVGTGATIAGIAEVSTRKVRPMSKSNLNALTKVYNDKGKLFCDLFLLVVSP